MRIALVVVAFESNERLKRHLGCLRGQTRPPDCVIIVNTGKSPVDWTKDETGGRFKVETMSFGNIGPAGGFREGGKKAYRDGYDLIIFADDDAYPAVPDVFMRLEKGAEEGHDAIAGYYADGVPIMLANHYLALTRNAIKKAGFHFAPFFMMMEDLEYFRRIQAGSEVFHDESIVIEHPFSLERSPKRGYYGMRNFFFLASIQKDFGRIIIGSAIELSRTAFIAISGNGSFLLWYMRALKHFIQGRMGIDDRPGGILGVEEADTSSLGPKLFITDPYKAQDTSGGRVIALGAVSIGGKERVDIKKAFDILLSASGRSVIVPKHVSYLAYPPFTMLAKGAYVYDDRTGKTLLLHRNNAILSAIFMMVIAPALAASAVTIAAMALLKSKHYDGMLKSQLEEDKAFCIECDGRMKTLKVNRGLRE